VREKSIFTLFLCSLVPLTTGNGLSPLLPAYAAELGASPADAGCQLALAFAALAIGMMASCWLSNRLKSRKGLIIAGGAMGIPVLWLAGQARNPWTLAALSAVWCFGAGMSTALVNTLAGLSADEGARGKVFGVLSLNAGLGTLVGGLAMGPIAERWGYPALFTCLSVFGLLWPVAALILEDSKAQGAMNRDTRVTRQSAGLGRDFYCLLAASVAATLAAYVFIVGRSLVMAELGFGATAISCTSALSEAPLLPLPVLLGRLSDRFGRRRFLVLGYLTATAGLLGLTASASPLHFWMNSVLVTVSFITGAVGTALVTDLVPRDALGKALSLFGAATGIAGILGCAGAGCAVQLFGPVSTFVAAALLPLVAVGFLLAIRQASQKQSAAVLHAEEASSVE
jgi:MFS family permease